MTVDDLVKGICIGSGNDAAVAMAERIGGTEENFVRMMNDKAKNLGLKNTNFQNACGLDKENHYSSARDMAIIAKELVKYEKILEEHNMENGLVEESIKYIQESYHKLLENGNR